MFSELLSLGFIFVAVLFVVHKFLFDPRSTRSAEVIILYCIVSGCGFVSRFALQTKQIYFFLLIAKL